MCLCMSMSVCMCTLSFSCVRYLLAPQVEVENNNFLILGSQQERDLVYPLHSKKAINTSIAMRVRIHISCVWSIPPPVEWLVKYRARYSEVLSDLAAYPVLFYPVLFNPLLFNPVLFYPILFNPDPSPSGRKSLVTDSHHNVMHTYSMFCIFFYFILFFIYFY